MSMKRVLICDDDQAVTNYLMVSLMQTGRFESSVENDSRLVPDLLDREEFDIILLDMDMPNISGMDILTIIREKGISTPVIILTGVSDVDLAVKAMKLGAFDYLTKPVDDDFLLERIDAAIAHHKLTDSIDKLPEELSREDLENVAAFEHLPTKNPAMIRVLHQAEKLASSELSVFIWGDLGTDKEKLARAIHNASSHRQGVFIAIDGSAQSPEKFPGDFFGQDAVWGGDGQEREGFLEQCEGGTLYLGDIEYLSLPVQMRLLRVLQTGEFYRESSTTILKSNVRFIVSSAHDLASPTFKDSFSQELLHHLMVNSLSPPPLRERMEDLPLLCEALLAEALKKINCKIIGFDEGFIDHLRQYDFPDNIQELRNIIEGSVVNSEGELLTISSLPVYIRKKISESGRSKDVDSKPMSLAENQREHIRRMLSYYDNDAKKTAIELGITEKEMENLLHQRV